jgi:alpha-glucosidase
VDAAVAHTIPNGTDTYKPYDVGTTQGVFIKNPDGSEYIGKVWPGYTVFPDYFHPNTTSWWTEMLQDWFDLGIEFDGLWEDMNEVSSFCDGSCGSNLTADQFNKGSSPGFALPGEPGNEVNNYPEWYDFASPERQNY